MKTNLSFFALAILWLNLITVQHLQAQNNTSYNLNSVPISGQRNSAFGIGALNLSTYGEGNNTATGSYALYSNTTGYYNTATGSSSLFSNTTGYNNTATGVNALPFNTIGINNTASGNNALYSNTVGEYNTGTGADALYNNTTGILNTASGARALYSNTTGNFNTATGYKALYSNLTGYYNIASGYEALYSNTTGYFNTASGIQALYNNTTGFLNTSSGIQALYNNTTGHDNTASGNAALLANRVGYYNTALGSLAGSGYSGSSSFDNTNTTFLGAQSTSTVAVDNSTTVGFGAMVDDDNQVRIGNTAITSIGGQVDWTTLSDGRFKNNLKEDVPGISFINKLRPITYNLDVSAIDSKLKAHIPQLKVGASKLITQSEPKDDQQKSKTAKAQIKYTGFVAQEVEKAAQELGYDFSGVDAPKNKEGFYGLRYSEFVVPLVKAVQEQQKQIEEQQKQIGELKELVAKLINGQGVNAPTHSTTTVTGAYLEQNTPNPFGGLTTIAYHLPAVTTTGKVVITSINGQVLKTLAVSGSQRGVLTLQAGSLSAGTYLYSLWVDNQAVDTKQMIVR